MTVSCINFSLPAMRKVTNEYQAERRTNSVLKPSRDHMALHRKKLEEVRTLLDCTITQRPMENLAIVDSLQRLAIDYHFQEDIQTILSGHYESIVNDDGALISSAGDNSLYYVALCFRVLRQNGYYVSTAVFDRFRDQDGKFGKQVENDLRGLMSLYQASHFAIDGEDILDQASLFTSEKLQNALPHLNRDHASVISHYLRNPYHKNITRFDVKHYIKAYQNEHEPNSISLNEFAKIDFNMVQGIHQNELQQVSSWWRDLGLSENLTFARDQLLKWYVVSMTTLEDPIYSEQRIQLTKPIALIYLMDDIFDVYGSLDDLMLFTEAINRWDVNAMEQLPCPMKMFLKTLYDVTDEISNDIFQRHGWNPINSLKRAWMQLCNAFLSEAKWFASGSLPGSDEYLRNGVITSGGHVVFVHMFFFLGQGINHESVDLVDNVPSLSLYPSTILRLWDDLGSAKDENQHGYDGSYIACYMKENMNSTIRSARQHAIDVISDTWKKLNKEYFSRSHFSLIVKKASLNAAKLVPLMYNYDGNQRLPSLEKHIKSSLYERIPLKSHIDSNT